MTWLSFFERLLARRWPLGLGLLALCAVAVLGAARVPMDPSIERMHPIGDAAKTDFDRYRRAFPGEDSQVFVIAEGPGVFTPGGLASLAKLEEALRGLPRVRHVVGPASAMTVEGLLFPEASRGSGEALREALAQARKEPLARVLVHPTRELAVVQVALSSGAGVERILAERAFTLAAGELLARHAGPEVKLTLSGAPAVRATLARMVEEDMGLLLPLALLVILGLVAFAYRELWSVLATAATLVVSWLWMVGAMGWVGVPFGVLTSFAPIVILIVSLTDTVHVLSDLEERRRAGTPYARALIEAMAHAAGPCLATELVIASGFLSMGFIGLTAVWEFGLATALGVVLAWGANMLVLPWVLSLRSRASAARARRELKASRTRPLDSVLAWVERQVVHRPRRVLVLASAVAVVSVLSITRLRHEYRVFDDLRQDSPLAAELTYAEGALGGLVPLAVFLEPERGREGAALSPEALGFQERVDAYLAGLPEHPPVVSLPRLLEPVYRAVFGPLGLLEKSEASTARAVTRLAKYQPLDTVLSGDRSAAGVVALLPNVGSERMHELVESARAFVSREVPPGYRATVTGNLAMTEHVTGMLTQGLLRSFLSALGVSFLAFFLVLRSVKLALIGLVPNVLPVGVLFGTMSLLGISLKPSTVIIASMALVIADDDTLQYLVRFKRRYLALKAEGAEAPHRRAALESLNECGRAMFVTSAAVAGGFLLLQLSRFEGIAHLGLLTGMTLWVAGLADAFLGPVLLMALKPDLGPARER
ncbi:MMPL family transporter [Archangium violaceum]|uniref:efflux RND transporter permease subunit n=1 Tax=Archangium violaceum TaxID=83451 RepID=UPI0019524888|nr:MMPL family transporter [Archangium violaceum]QRN95208.1 MMPL family transporter [Archangium violaceum]